MSEDVIGMDQISNPLPGEVFHHGVAGRAQAMALSGDRKMEVVKGYRPEIEVIQQALEVLHRNPEKDYPRWSMREIIALDWLVRCPSMLLPEEPKTVTELERFLGVKVGFMGRLARRDHYVEALAEVARQIRKLHSPAVKMEVLAGALNRRTYNEEGEEVRKLSPKDQLAYIRTNLELDGEIGGRGQELPSVQGAESWTLTRERQVLEVKNARPALEAAIVEEIGGELKE